MPYVKRGESGEIVAISETRAPGFEEELSTRDRELAAFLARVSPERESIAETDQGFVRVLEDLIELMVARNLIRFTDLPDVAQSKIMRRQRLRGALHPHVDLLDEDQEEPLI